MNAESLNRGSSTATATNDERVITLDLETYYDREYSLSKMTTEEYVRDHRFEVIGIGIKHGAQPTEWFPKPQVKDALAAIDWSDKFVVCQNTMFDAAILKWHFDINPKVWCDTLSMSRALYPHEKSHSLSAQASRMQVGVKGDEVVHAMGKRYADFHADQLNAYGAYCINDVDLTYALFNLYMDKGFPIKELKLIDLTLRMYVDPVLELDIDLLTDHLQNVRDHKQMLMDNLQNRMLEEGNPEFTHLIFSEGPEGGLRKMLMSNQKFADALRLLDVEPPVKVSATTGRMTYAFAKTDDGMLALQDHPNLQVQTLVAARLGNKSTLEETRTERFIGMASRGKFPVPLRYYGAHSGRWSGQDKINLQNLPTRGKNSNTIKRAIKAPPGHVVIDCDSSQIEARTLAWLAGQDDLVEAFEQKQDVYKIMASYIYKIDKEEVNKTQRQVGKTVILGAGYGVGHNKLQKILKLMAGVEVTEHEAKQIVDTYRHTYYRIPQLWSNAQRSLGYLSMGQEFSIDVHELCRTSERGITLPSGLWIQYPGLVSAFDNGQMGYAYLSKTSMEKVYGGLVTENICQAVARCIVAEQMLKIAKRYKVVMTVHDAVACIAPEDQAEEAAQYVRECMSQRPSWAPTLPLACEVGWGATYGDCDD